MKIAPIPENEPDRLAALRRFAILDTPGEAEFDDLTWLASHICGTPIALISIVDSNRQWFKSTVGLNVSETDRNLAFCAHAIHGTEIMEVPNALKDDRFHDNPLVTGGPEIRFYAGMPLTTMDNLQLGTLCVIDRVPRKLSPQQHAALTRLGRRVMAQMELRRALLNRLRNEQCLVLENEVYRILLRSAGLDEATPRLLEAVAAVLGYGYGIAWRMDASGKFLRCAEVCVHPEPDEAGFVMDNRGKTLGSGEGLPGAVWATGLPAWISDLTACDDLQRERMAAVGMRRALAFPILFNDACLGVMEFFQSEPGEPNAEVLDVLATVGRQIGDSCKRDFSTVSRGTAGFTLQGEDTPTLKKAAVPSSIWAG